MPWLESEYPSDDALKAYLDEACYWLRSPEPTPELHLAVGEAWELGVRELHDWAYTSLWNGLKRLAELPRSDPFWKGTNRRPTIYKLPRFVHQVLADDPHDVAALEALAGLAILQLPADFSADVWVRLWRLRAIPLRRAVLAAIWCDLNCSDALADALIAESGFAAAVHEQLADLETARFPQIRSFAQRVKRGSGPSSSPGHPS